MKKLITMILVVLMISSTASIAYALTDEEPYNGECVHNFFTESTVSMSDNNTSLHTYYNLYGYDKNSSILYYSSSGTSGYDDYTSRLYLPDRDTQAMDDFFTIVHSPGNPGVVKAYLPLKDNYHASPYRFRLKVANSHTGLNPQLTLRAIGNYGVSNTSPW